MYWDPAESGRLLVSPVCQFPEWNSLGAPAAGYPPSTMITQLLPGAGVPSESREKQPLPLPSLTLFQSKREGIILVFFFPTLVWLTETKQATQHSWQLSTFLCSSDRRGNVVLCCWGWNPKPSISRAEGRSQLPPSCKGSPGEVPPLLTGPPRPHGSGEEHRRGVYSFTQQSLLSFCYAPGSRQWAWWTHPCPHLQRMGAL